MAGGLLDVSQRDASVEGGGDECMSESVGTYPLVDPAVSGDAPHDPTGGVTIEAAAIGAEEDRSFQPLADGQVDGPGRAGSEGDGDDLAALAQDGQRAVTAFETKSVDVGPGSLRYPQPVEDQHRDEGVFSRGAQTGGDQQRPDLVSVQSGGV